MLAQVKTINGVKTLVPLTSDTGSGLPLLIILPIYSNQVPDGYLPCNGVQFDTTQYPALYQALADDHTPDLRESTLKGIGESGRTVGAHVKTGGLAIGEFIDDRVQTHGHGSMGQVAGGGAYFCGSNTSVGNGSVNDVRNQRTGATTEVKAVGVNWIIKATTGLAEAQVDYVLNQLSPVDVVALNNLHSVTSDAVYKALHNSNDVFLGNQGNFIMPNGLIIKCGVCTGGSGNNDNWSVNFSNAFPNGLFQVLVTPNSASATCPSGWCTVNRTSSGFKIFCKGDAPSGGFTWLAIGA